MRRGNKSNKVPNVKLRPAQPSSRSKTESEPSSYWVQETQDENPEPGSLALCPRPFKGVVVCATGIVDKPTIFKQAVELGATSASAFTDRVTHLVATEHGGAKYLCALERRIPILHSAWITESYQTWLKGDDVDLQQSVSKYRLPIFSGVVLCISGISDITRRTEINKLLTRQQGTYVKNIERPVKVTHLLCSGDEETEKMQYAEKFNKKGEAKICMVWEEWFWDCLDFGGRFNEATYQVNKPRPERKFTEVSSSQAPHIESSPDEEQLPPQSKPAPPKPSGKGLDDDEEEEPATVKRVAADTLQMWETLLKPRGFEIAAGKLVRSPSKSQGPGHSRPQFPPSPSPPRPLAERGGGGSIIDSFRHANSFANLQTKEKPAGRLPFRRIPTSGSLLGKNGESSSSSSFNVPPQDIPQPSLSSSSSQLFQGLKFRALGEAKSASVRSAVEGCCGRIPSGEESDEEVDYIIVRLVSGSKIYMDERDEMERLKYRTECWLERCIFEERICSPDEHVAFTPLNIQTPIPGAELVNLSFSGLDQSETCWIRRLARALGINIAQTFSRRSTHLLCPSGSGAKFDKAQEWGVPVVNMGWLEKIATEGILPDASEYQVLSAEGGQLGDEMDVDVLPVQFPKSAKAKGKEKEVEIDHTIVDITNNQPDSMEQFIDLRKPAERHTARGTTAKPVQPPDEDDSLFGRPLDILSNPDKHTLPTSTPPPSSGSTSINLVPRADSLHSSSGPARRPTPRDIRRDMEETRIPSSKSPSPLKIPARPSCSPSKVPNEVTKALQDSITSLLGKRPSEEDATRPQTRAGKRARPHAKPKLQSRQTSRGTKSRPTAPLTPPGPIPYGFNNNFEPDDELNIIDGEGSVQEQSMRVMYEDPGQLEERKRLLGMVESQSPDEQSVKKGKISTRRSTRMAGF